MIEVVKLGQNIGAEIKGVDLSKPMSNEVFQETFKAFFENEVVVFRDQNLQPSDQVSFTRRFGDLEKHVRKESLLKGMEEIFIISNMIGDDGKPVGAQDVGRFWHSDLSYKKIPSMLSALYSIVIPVDANGITKGDTQYSSATHAYATLPDELKLKLSELKAVHSYKYYRTINREAQSVDAQNGGKKVMEPPLTEKMLMATPDVNPPLVRTHPVTKKKCLFINEGHTSHVEGMSAEESKELLNSLYEHMVKPEFKYVHKWKKGDLLMWDNCALQHKATFDYELPLQRLMHRTTVCGSEPY